MRPERFDRLRDILLRAKDLPEDERRLYLDEACGSDAEMRAEAESLLAHGRRTDALMKTGALVQPGPLSPDGAASPVQPRASPIGRRIGRYRITGELGKGGMGVVYQAEDPILDRTIALKFLRPDSVGGEKAVARFTYEARAAAALDHPNICTIYEIAESEGQTFICMALVEGTTLRERIRSGSLPIDETIRIGLQIAEGLREAHEKGIVHRDIKPSNVMLSPGGQVKIMDFGLARTGDHTGITKTGARLGTVGYMSPEQMRGERVDTRTDIWALGVVLYEMLVGKLPFKGESDHALGYNIVHEKVRRSSRSRGDVPPLLDALIQRCLEKEPRRRLDASEVVQVLEHLRRPSSASGAAGLLRRRRSGRFWALTTAGFALLAAVGIYVGVDNEWFRSPPPRDPIVKRLTALPPERQNLWSSALSPDGRYVAVPNGRNLDVFSIETGEARRVTVPGMGRVNKVSWSPDGEALLCDEAHSDRWEVWLRNIVLNTNRRVFERPGSAYEIHSALSYDGGSIAVLRDSLDEIWTMDASGANLRMVLGSAPDEDLRNVTWSPDGGRIGYLQSHQSATGSLTFNLETTDLEGNRTVLIEDDPRLDFGDVHQTLCWLPDGRIVFGRFLDKSATTSELWAIPVDETTGLPRGEPSRLFGLQGSQLRSPTVSADGRRLSFNKVTQVEEMPLLELDEQGDSVGMGLVATQRWPGRPAAWTRDGGKVFFGIERFSGDVDIYVRDLGTGLDNPFVKTPEAERPQCLTPDGDELLFWQGEALMRIPVEGGQASEILRSPRQGRVMCGAAPGSPCVVGRVEGAEVALRRLDLQGGQIGEEVLRVDIGAFVTGPRFDYALSPDGTRVAVVEDTDRLRVFNLDDGSMWEDRGRHGRGWPQFVSWFGDGRSLCLAGRQRDAGYWLERVSIAEGDSKRIWTSTRQWPSWPVPSPDGRRVAFQTRRWGLDVWMIEDF